MKSGIWLELKKTRFERLQFQKNQKYKRLKIGVLEYEIEGFKKLTFICHELSLYEGI